MFMYIYNMYVTVCIYVYIGNQESADLPHRDAL